MAVFFKEVTRENILRVEYEDPFKDIKLFNLVGVESRALTLEDVPQQYRPYKGCLFDVLGEPDDDVRATKLKEFFKTLAAEGDPGRDCGLLFTIMQLWRCVYLLAMKDPAPEDHVKTFDYLLEVGMVDALMRILHYGLDETFRVIEYNRYIPYRITELFFAATQGDLVRNNVFIEKMLEDERRALNTFFPILKGAITWAEQLSCCQAMGNLSCYPRGVTWLLDNPHLGGVMSRFLWCSYDLMYTHFKQYEDRKLNYHKFLIQTDIAFSGEQQVYQPNPLRIADLTTFVTLCAVCNLCAAHPEEPMEKIKPSLIAISKEGMFWHLDTICTGILLNESKYTDLTMEKFLSLLSWCCFNKESQQIVVKQLKSLPYSRQDNPFCFIKPTFTKSRSVVACLVTHAMWLDYEKGCHYSVLGLVSLLSENDEVAMEIVKVAGSQLFDLAHSFHHVQMPGDCDPTSIKRAIFEAFIRLSGSIYFTEKGEKSRPATKWFEDPPECILEARQFCERFMREMKMGMTDKQIAVRCADAFKKEGNEFFIKREYRAAVECYTRALETCPLTCTERRVTYHSNRAECYLKTDRPHPAIHDCNKSLAMNPNNLKARWRRAQAYQNLGKKYPAALDLLTIRRKEEQAKEILGPQVYADLDKSICELLDNGAFLDLAEQKFGTVIYSGTLNRHIGVNKEHVHDKMKLPSFRGASYMDVFGQPETESDAYYTLGKC